MRIIDAQIHELLATGQRWDRELEPDDASILSCELAIAALDAVGVEHAVLSARSGWTQVAIARHPGRFSALAVFDPDAPDLEEQVERAWAQPGICGVRVVITWPEEERKLEKLRAGGYKRLFRILERYGIPTCFNLSGAVSEGRRIAEAHPGLPVIIDNLGLIQPPIRTPESPPWKHLPEVLGLASLPNVFIKFIGAPTLSNYGYPFVDVWPRLTQIIEAYGPERLMWGSDFTRCRGLNTYAEAVAYVLYTDQLSASDKEQLFNQTIARVMRLGV